MEDRSSSYPTMKMIADTTVATGANPQSGVAGGGDTVDKVFVLSIEEVNRYFASDVERECVPTYYAAAAGAWTDSEVLVNGRAACWWWLRTPGKSDMHAARVRSNGTVDYVGTGIYSEFNAVRPAMWIDLDA